MISVGKLVIIGVAAIITSINVAANKSAADITLSRELRCMDQATILSGLKNNGFSPIVSNLSETNGTVDSIVQTWVAASGEWVVIEHNIEYKVTCILGAGEKTKIHISSKQSWV